MPTAQREELVGVKRAERRFAEIRELAATEIAKLDEHALDAIKLVQLLALSGMRLGEVTRIVWPEMDFEKGQFTVSGGAVGTKNGKTRIMPVFPRLRRFLEEIRPESADSGGKRIVGTASTSQRWGRLVRQEG